MVDLAQVYTGKVEPFDIMMRLALILLYLTVMTIMPAILVLENYFMSKSTQPKKARRDYSRCLDRIFWLNIGCFLVYFSIRLFETHQICNNIDFYERYAEMCSSCTNITVP